MLTWRWSGFSTLWAHLLALVDQSVTMFYSDETRASKLNIFTSAIFNTEKKFYTVFPSSNERPMSIVGYLIMKCCSSSKEPPEGDKTSYKPFSQGKQRRQHTDNNYFVFRRGSFAWISFENNTFLASTKHMFYETHLSLLKCFLICLM